MTEAYTEEHFTIKSWAEEDRPREKLLAKGKSSLSDAELVAILIGSGSRNESAVSLSQKILKSVDNNLNNLGKTSLSNLMKFKGIGEAKAITIAAALELGRRRQLSDIKERPQIRSSKDAYHVLAPLIMDLPHEEFWILLLNRANKVIGRERVSIGGVAGTVVDAKIIFRKALEMLASGIILCHNHPSGNLSPSHADLEITKKLKRAGETLEINILDHLIIAENEYFSFADEGKL
ncbi:MAG: DNA repair protein RadC [Maribacter sp.]|jgi:DNA repair protein RadC